MAKDKKMKISIETFRKKTGISKLNTGLKATIRLAKSAGAGLKRLGGRALIGMIAGTTVVVWKLVDALKAFAVQELSEVNLVAALKQMGQYTDEYYEKLKNLASQYQETTKVGDETWLKQFAQLTRFGMNADNVDRVADAVKNLAGLMDGNVQGATLAMQRAIEGEFSMFSRYGIKLDLTGDKVKDLNTLFEMLAEKGAGAMEARAGTLQGAWDGLTNAIGDFKEEVGRTFERATNLRGVLGSIETFVKKLQDSAKSGGLKNLIEGAVEKASEFLEQVKGIAAYIQTEGGDAARDIFSSAGKFLKGAAKSAAEAAVSLLAKAVPAIGREIGLAIKDAMFGDSMSKEARKTAAADADAEFGVDDIKSGRMKSRRRDELRRDPEYQKRLQELEQQHIKRLIEEKGLSFSGKFGTGAGALEMEEASAEFGGYAAKGRVVIEEREAEQERRQEEARKIAQRPEEAKKLYQQQRREYESAVQSASTYGPSPKAAMQNLQKERSQQKDANALMAEALKTNTYSDELMSLMRSFLQANNQLATEVSTLKSQIKNGRS